ncbi:hypothetical protein Bpfe_027978, partial [Biomphalaria pfeifferi]
MKERGPLNMKERDDSVTYESYAPCKTKKKKGQNAHDRFRTLHEKRSQRHGLSSHGISLLSNILLSDSGELVVSRAPPRGLLKMTAVRYEISIVRWK